MSPGISCWSWPSYCGYGGISVVRRSKSAKNAVVVQTRRVRSVLKCGVASPQILVTVIMVVRAISSTLVLFMPIRYSKRSVSRKLFLGVGTPQSWVA